LLRLDQPLHGPLIPPSPAQALATVETGRVLAPDDPAVATMAVLLTQLTAAYVEDAPRIAELTIRIVSGIRAANRAASPLDAPPAPGSTLPDNSIGSPAST
jgi:hypothetical protein